MAKKTKPAETAARLHTGGCHCGAVRYEVTLDATHGSRCNCSICTKVAQLGAMVKPHAFRLTQGQDALGHYVWGGKISTRHFCKHCGIHCYGSGHLAELGGDFVSVNLNTLDELDPNAVEVIHWDGRHDNWQAGPRSAPWPLKLATTAA
ncbi:MAG TPA: GFA family protein [Polyangiaceae bacterium]|jgi:hypothetical protein